MCDRSSRQPGASQVCVRVAPRKGGRGSALRLSLIVTYYLLLLTPPCFFACVVCSGTYESCSKRLIKVLPTFFWRREGDSSAILLSQKCRISALMRVEGTREGTPSAVSEYSMRFARLLRRPASSRVGPCAAVSALVGGARSRARWCPPHPRKDEHVPLIDSPRRYTHIKGRADTTQAE